MSALALTAGEMLVWIEKDSKEWRRLVTTQPEVMAIPCDVMGASTAGELLRHIVVVELRYAQRLAGLPIAEYAEVVADSAESLYATHDRAMALYRQLLAAPDTDWEGTIEFMTQTQGKLRASRRAIFFHALLHSQRHYAQLATLMRQHGVATWGMDYLMVAAERV